MGQPPRSPPPGARHADPPVPTIRKMAIGAWIGVRTNPSQRDHINRRAAHLDRLELQHFMVAAAQLPDETLVKLDGHTRAHPAPWPNC